MRKNNDTKKGKERENTRRKRVGLRCMYVCWFNVWVWKSNTHTSLGGGKSKRTELPGKESLLAKAASV